MNGECLNASASRAVGASSTSHPAAAAATAAIDAIRPGRTPRSAGAEDAGPSAATDSHRNAAIDTSAARRCEPTASAGAKPARAAAAPFSGKSPANAAETVPPARARNTAKRRPPARPVSQRTCR